MQPDERMDLVSISDSLLVGVSDVSIGISGRVPHLLEMFNDEGKTVLIIDADQAQADIILDKEMITECLNGGITHGRDPDRIQRNVAAYDHLLQVTGVSEEELRELLDPILVCFLNGFHKRMVQKLTDKDTYPSNRCQDE